MPKIRGMHPDFWTDEAVVACGPFARLLFAGLWNFACDNGHVEDKPIQLKMRILPADPVDVDALLDELVGAGLVTRDGTTVTVPNLTKRQRVDRRYFTCCSVPGCERPENPALTGVRTTGTRGGHDEHTTSTRRGHDVSTRGPLGDGDGDGDGDGELTPPTPPTGGNRRRRPTQPEPEPWESYPEIPPEDPIEEPRP